jgi:glycosyltransferase involved in cell wall biosynthesis
MTDTTRHPIRLAYVIKEMEMGGSQTHLTQVLRLLDRSRFQPLLYCLTGKGPLLEPARALGVPIHAPAAGSSFKGLGLVARCAALARALRRDRIDIVHNYLLRANLVGSVSARLARVPVVLCSKRGCHWRRGLELVSARIGNALADTVMVNAEAVRDFVHGNEGCAREKMVVIPSGVDTDRFQPLPAAQFKERLGLPEERLIVGVVTRMRVRKGVEEFIRAIGQVRLTRPEVHGVIVGEVSLDEPLQEMVRSLGLQEHLSLIGRRGDMPEVFSAFDVFVLSSHDEGMSNAILEAMAMEKAVVATDVGGTGEVIRHGQSGLLVPPKDPHALATAISEVLAQPARAHEMGRLGRRIVEDRFSAHAMVRQMEQVYLELAAARGLVVAKPIPTTV